MVYETPATFENKLIYHDEIDPIVHESIINLYIIS